MKQSRVVSVALDCFASLAMTDTAAQPNVPFRFSCQTATHSAVIACEGGRSSIPETPDNQPRSLWNTGSPAFAGHDNRENMNHYPRGAIAPELCAHFRPLQ